MVIVSSAIAAAAAATTTLQSTTLPYCQLVTSTFTSIIAAGSPQPVTTQWAATTMTCAPPPVVDLSVTTIITSVKGPWTTWTSTVGCTTDWMNVYGACSYAIYSYNDALNRTVSTNSTSKLKAKPHYNTQPLASSSSSSTGSKSGTGSEVTPTASADNGGNGGDEGGAGGGPVPTDPSIPPPGPPSPPPPPPPPSPPPPPPLSPQPPPHNPTFDPGYDGDDESSKTKTKSRSKKPVTRRPKTTSSTSPITSPTVVHHPWLTTYTSSNKAGQTTVITEDIRTARHHPTYTNPTWSYTDTYYCSTMTVAPSSVVSAQGGNSAAYVEMVDSNMAQECPFDHVKKITDYSASTSVFTPDRSWATHRASESYGFKVTSASGMKTKASTKAGEE